MTDPHRVLFLAFDGVKMLDIAGPAEVFAEATRLGGHYELGYVSPAGGDVVTSIGARLPTDSPRDGKTAGTLMVAGGDRLVGEPMGGDLVAAVGALAGRAGRVASVCTGAFLLAEAGLLDGRQATTHWLHAACLARVYPQVEVLADALFVRDGETYTSAGVSSGIDLALALVEADHGPDLATEVARALVVYMQRAGGQSQFSAALEWPRPSTPGLRAAVAAVTSDPGLAHSVSSLAAAANVSARHLTRLFRIELGTTPAKFIEQTRLDTAKALLDAGRNVTETAQLAGFGSDESLRRAFTGQYGLPPSHYRGRFQRTA